MSDSQKKYDVIVVGGGVIGCAIAWRLGQSALRTLVIDRGKIGAEASWAAGGMLAPLAEADAADAFLELAVESRARYAEFARELEAVSGHEIDYRTEGTLYLALTSEDEEELERRWQWQHAAGLHLNKLSAAQILQLEPSLTPTIRWGLQFPEDHQVDNRKLSVALAAAAFNAHVEFLTETPVENIVASGSQIIGVETKRGEIHAPYVVVAAGCWSQFISSKIPVEPLRGQMIALKMPASHLRHVVYSRRGYLIPRLNGSLISGSTMENVGYQKAVTGGGLQQVLHQATEMMPGLKDFAIEEIWSGLRPHSRDDWPVLGSDPFLKGLIYATGHYRNGILLTPITATAISELILFGKSRVNIEAFDITRFAEAAPAGAHKTSR